MFGDEARFGRMNRPRPCWAPIGTRPAVACQLIREYVYLYGAVSPKDGTCIFLILPAPFSEAGIAKDGTCECCRLGLAFAGAGRPAVIFRNIFGKSERDHAVTTFADPTTPGPVYRVSVDDWDTDVCPHHGPSLSLGDDGTDHVT